MLPLIIHFYFFLATTQQPPAFTAQTIDDKVSMGYGLAIGDVDGDRKPDILLADRKQFVWYRNGDWERFVMAYLTASDHVCIAARDLDGDGKVEVAVGAQWNPGETSDTSKSGSVHYLRRPKDPTGRWEPVQLHHEPTVHRMKWVRTSNGRFYLVVVPLHGQGNRGGEGKGVNVLAYEFPRKNQTKWNMYLLDSSMHLTHNFDVVESAGKPVQLLLAGKEGIKLIREPFDGKLKPDSFLVAGEPAGEIRKGKLAANKSFLACIEPMHGNRLAVYLDNRASGKVVLDEDLKEGHALAVADFNRSGNDQVVMGRRIPNKENKVGIKIYSSEGTDGKQWKQAWIDENGIACEDLQVSDLNADGKPDVIAAGSATHNLVIYWNK